MATYCLNSGNLEKGLCVCPIQFAGSLCERRNASYTAAFVSIFSLLFLAVASQLVRCVYLEYRARLSFSSAFRVTTQKLLLAVLIALSGERVIFFALQGHLTERWLEPLDSFYFPAITTALSLIACYWSEMFFLEQTSDKATRTAQFLSKSSVAFTVFNVVLHTSVATNFLVSGLGYHWAFNSFDGTFLCILALLLFVVCVIVLAIGVEMFFKVKGAFTKQERLGDHFTVGDINRKVALKSRVAIVFQGIVIVGIVLSALTAATQVLWKRKVDVTTVNVHDILRRVFEVAGVVWFLGALSGNSASEKLWLLNPKCLFMRDETGADEDIERSPLLTGKKKLLKHGDDVTSTSKSSSPSSSAALLAKKSHREVKNYKTFSGGNNNLAGGFEPLESTGECWICLDSDRDGKFIQPCLCKGGMKKVHHDCLRRWLQYLPEGRSASCSACKHSYVIKKRRNNLCTTIAESKQSKFLIPTVLAMVTILSLIVAVFRCTQSWSNHARIISFTGLMVSLMILTRCFLESCSAFKSTLDFQAYSILSNKNTSSTSSTSSSTVKPVS